jgi:hypothetical protein
MPQISRTTNPTGLINVDRRHFIVRLNGNGADRQFAVARLDHEAAKLTPDTQVGCVAHAGNAEEYFQLGTVGSFDGGWQPIPGLDNGRPLRFRFLFTKSGTSKLVGYTDHVHAINESGDLGPSLVDIEPTDLHGVLWRLELPSSGGGPSEKPNILVDRSVFPSAFSAVKCTWFVALVMPEVMRRVANEIARTPDALDDEGNWMHSWKSFLDALKVPAPELDNDSDEEEIGAWANDVADRFARGNAMQREIARISAEVNGEEPQ